MKLKYIFASIVATLALAVSCEKEADHYLDEIKVSTSYVSLSTGVGANTTITLTATNNWNIVMSDEDAKWLTVSPMSGSAGETTVTFSAPAYDAGRSAEISISCGDKTQFINVIQGVKTVSEVSCAVVMKNPGKTYRVTGTVTKIKNTTYGNWNMDDGSYDYSGASADNKDGLYIYGTLDAKGNTKNFSSWGLEVGDKITVEGPSKDYNGTIELVDVTVIKIVKSLIKVDEVVYPNPEQLTPAPDYLPVAGGEAQVTLVNKGESLKVVIPEEAKSWLSISSLDGNTVTLKALPNEGGDRETTVTFGTNQGNEAYTCELAVTQKGAIVAATVAEFLAAEVGNVQYRLTGVISKDYPSDKQGQSFYIKDWSGEVLVYRADNFKESALEIGDVCTVVGKRGAYKETPQMVNGHVEAVVELVEVADIPTVLAAKDGDWFRVTGTIKDIANKVYGNMTITDGTNDLFIYGVYPGYGATGDNRKNLVEKLGLKVGDSITVFGAKGTNKGTPQISNGIYWSHQSADEGGEGGDEGGGEQSATSVTFTQDQLAAAAANGTVVKMNDFVSFTNSSDYGTTTVTELRVYSEKVLEVKAVEGYVINKIEFVCGAKGDAKYGPGAWGAGAPTGYTFDAEGVNGKWEGSSASVSFTASKQVRIKGMTVSYAKVN